MEPVPESPNTMCRLLHLWLMLVATGGVEPVPESPRTLCRLATFCRCLLLPLVMWDQYQNFVSACHLLSMSAVATGDVEPVPELCVGLPPSVDVCFWHWRCGTSTTIKTFCRFATFCRCLLLPTAVWNQYQKNILALCVGFATFCRCL